MRIGRLARLLPAFAAAVLAGGASAATLTESAVAGGAFGARWDTPTEVARGFDAITGTGSQNVFDNFVFTGLPTGAQKLTLTFTAPEGVGHSYSAGASVLYATQPFRWGWDGSYASTAQIDYYSRSKSYDLDLGDDFSGKLYLALNFTHGSNLAYTIGAPSNAMPVSPAPVPLPAGAVLAGSGATLIAGLGLLRRRRPALT